MSQYLHLISISSCIFALFSCSETQNPSSSDSIEKHFIQDTLISNTDDVYTVIGDTIPIVFFDKENMGVFLSLYRNEECLYQDTLFPSAFGHINLWETNNFKENLSIHGSNRKYNLYVLNENMILIIGYFKNELLYKHQENGWKSVDLNIYPNFISRFLRVDIVEDEKKFSFVGENWDLAGNPYKGDSLVISYENGVFEIDAYYPKSRLTNVTYYE